MSRSGQIMLGLGIAALVIILSALWLRSCEGSGPENLRNNPVVEMRMIHLQNQKK